MDTLLLLSMMDHVHASNDIVIHYLNAVDSSRIDVFGSILFNDRLETRQQTICIIININNLVSFLYHNLSIIA